MGLVAWIGKVIATLIAGPGVAVIGDPGERVPGRAPRIVALAALAIVVPLALSMVWSRP
jgi:hypothetical protein